MSKTDQMYSCYMTRKELAMDDFEYHHFINEKSILVITYGKELKIINCPFIVKDRSGEAYLVTAIGTYRNQLYYQIDSQYHYCSRYTIPDESAS